MTPRFGQPTDRVHVFVDRRSLCGLVDDVDELDLFDTVAGPRVWAARPEDRCRACEHAWEAR